MDIQIYSDIAGRANAVLLGTREHAESEYPPFATALFWFADNVSPKRDFASSWLVLIVTVSVLAWCYLRMFSARDALLLAAALPLSVLLLGHDMVFARYDIFVALALILSVRTFARGRVFESALWLTVACSLKVVPILGVVFLLLMTPWRKQWGLFAGLIAGAALTIGLSVAVLGVGGTVDNLVYMSGYHADRAIQLESTWSALSLLQALVTNRTVHTGFQQMSVVNIDLGTSFVSLAKLLVLSGTAWVAYRAWKTKESREYGLLISGVLVWALAVSPVLSPQYFTWVVPLLLVLLVDRICSRKISTRALGTLLVTVLVAVLTRWLFPWNYDALIDQETLPVLILGFRNALLFVLVYLLFTESRVMTPLPAVPSAPVCPASKAFLIDTVLFVVAIVTFVVLRPQLAPSMTGVTYAIGEGPVQAAESLPVSKDGEGEEMILTATLYVTPVSQQRFFRIRPDDCVERVTVNGYTLPAHLVEFCDGVGPGRIFDFGGHLVLGANSVTVTIRNTGGPMGADIIPSVTPLLWLVIVIVVCTCVWYAARLRHFWVSLLPAARARGAKMLYTLAILWSRSPFVRRLFFRILLRRGLKSFT